VVEGDGEEGDCKFGEKDEEERASRECHESYLKDVVVPR